MSAYASLPGSFLPPFFAFGTPSSTTEKDHAEPKTKDSGRDPPSVDATSSSTPNVAQSTSATASVSPSPSSTSTSSSSSSSSGGSSSNHFVSQSAFHALPLFSGEEPPPASTSPPSSHPSDIIIAIRSARVDPVQLIKSLTSRGSNIARRTANFIARTPAAATAADAQSPLETSTAEDADTDADDAKKGGEDEEASAHSSPGLCYEDTDSDEEYSMYDYSDDFSTPDDGNDDDDAWCDDSRRGDDRSSSDADPTAIEFELSITFQGRKYNATRAFPTFVKLRNDLLREVNGANEGDYCRRGGKRHGHAGGGAKNFIVHGVPKDAAGNSAQTAHPTHDKNRARGNNEGVSVPELPRVSPESLGHGGRALSGVARSGFALLQATAQHYCPEMECWMRQVIHAFPCSQSLSSFLWEPLSSSNANWETIGEGGVLGGGGDDDDDECRGRGRASIDLSAFSKQPPHARGKRGSNKFSKGSRLRRAGSNGTLDSIEEGDGYHSDHST